jgi:hypothetical protein
LVENCSTLSNNSLILVFIYDVVLYFAKNILTLRSVSVVSDKNTKKLGKCLVNC